MIRIGKYLLAPAAALALIACGGTAVDNKPSNTNATNANTNAGKATAAPNKDALFAMDKQANEAWIKGDTSFFNGFLSDKFVSYDQGQRRSKADLVKMMADFKCDVKTWSVDDPQMVTIDADTVVLTYKGMFDGACSGPDGSMKLPSPIRAASIYVRSGDKWQGVFHAENLIIDPKAPPPPPPAAGKKDAAKKEESKPADKPAGDANTEALAKVHQSGWEAWKAKDARRFEEMATASLSIVDPMGRWIGTKADTIKHWTEMKCEGVTKVNVSDGVATALSPTVELLTLKGAADGTCEGQKNGDIYQSSLYVKEGDAWKLAFMFEAPAM